MLTTSRFLIALLPAVLDAAIVSAPLSKQPAATSMRPLKKVAVGIVGTGLVGSEFLQQLESTRDMLTAQGLDVTVASISKTKPNEDGERQPWMLCDDEEGCTLDDVEAGLADPAAGEQGDFLKMADFVKSCSDHAVIIDATASEEVSDYYSQWLAKGVNVVTPNKKAGSGDLKRWKACLDAMQQTGAQWGDETTVGAGLPILNVLRTDLLATGDKVKTIEGIFSGTLSYLVRARQLHRLPPLLAGDDNGHAACYHRHGQVACMHGATCGCQPIHLPPRVPLRAQFNTYKPGMKFSDVINDAKEKGFTEPDPRDDLSGTDVARKVTILARACGLEVDLESVPVESLVPAALQDWSPAEGEELATGFIKQMEAFDDEKAELIATADAAGEVLRFVGVVDVEAGTVAVELRRYPKTHPFAGTQFADNICAFSTERYAPQPLVVQGPGAGAAVTAAGMYADFIRIAKSC